MAGKSGKAVTLKVGDGASPEQFVLVGGARNHGIDLDQGFVDDSDKDSGGWSSVGPYGLKKMRVTMTGVYKGSQGELLVLAHVNSVSPSPINVQLIEDGIGTWQFAAYIKRTVDAPHDNILGQTFTIDNQGAASFTAESPQS